MATIKSFEDIEAWKAARKLSQDIYELTLKGSFNLDFSLKGQINKSSGSVMDNIAEGFERGGTREFVQFLSIARGSCGEVRSQLYRAYDRRHIQESELDTLREQALKVSKMITGFMQYLLSSDIKGMKFSEPEEPYYKADPSNQ
jgi:four helix bundle protein